MAGFLLLLLFFFSFCHLHGDGGRAMSRMTFSATHHNPNNTHTIRNPPLLLQRSILQLDNGIGLTPPMGLVLLLSSSSQRPFLFLLLNLHALFLLLNLNLNPNWILLLLSSSPPPFCSALIQPQSWSFFIASFLFFFIFLGFIGGIAGISSTAMYRKNSYGRQVKASHSLSIQNPPYFLLCVCYIYIFLYLRRQTVCMYVYRHFIQKHVHVYIFMYVYRHCMHACLENGYMHTWTECIRELHNEMDHTFPSTMLPSIWWWWTILDISINVVSQCFVTHEINKRLLIGEWMWVFGVSLPRFRWTIFNMWMDCIFSGICYSRNQKNMFLLKIFFVDFLPSWCFGIKWISRYRLHLCQHWLIF